MITNLDHRIRNQQISLNRSESTQLLAHVLTTTTQEVRTAHVREQQLIGLSSSDVTLRPDTACPGLYNGSYGNWFVATNPCSILVSDMIFGERK